MIIETVIRWHKYPEEKPEEGKGYQVILDWSRTSLPMKVPFNHPYKISASKFENGSFYKEDLVPVVFWAELVDWEKMLKEGKHD